ncbi:MAG: bifunctional 4-hydroxy-2-oxoglutarate aldolase/2-dehydro-3-deoxy-phosphogluconate aldolase [Planctomycetota bacterium]
MERHGYAASLEAAGVVAVVRIPDRDALVGACHAMIAGGVTGIEITMSVAEPFAAIRLLDAEFGDSIQLGVGSVVTPDDATRAIDAGARYVVSPIFAPAVIEATRRANAVSVSGAITPTEAHHAASAGADIVKIFPADVVGMSYFKSILAPMPWLRLMPTGGVSIENAGDWIRAGAVAVGVGSALLDKRVIDQADWATLESNAHQLKANVDAAKTDMGASS